MTRDIFEQFKRLKAIADTGLLYATNSYDRERYQELLALSVRLLGDAAGLALNNNTLNVLPTVDYPTAKVDIRGMILSADKKILLVRESLDNKWSLPGGWADIGFSPKEAIIKEIKEETGLTASAEKLLAVFDKRMHPHPPELLYVYKMVFYCEAAPGELQKGFDILDAAFFAIDDLPELSEARILETQLQLLYHKIITQDWEAYTD
jgi:ADP-ribose pyrophosphatase YjhB (NUDIX family)